MSFTYCDLYEKIASQTESVLETAAVIPFNT